MILFILFCFNNSSKILQIENKNCIIYKSFNRGGYYIMSNDIKIEKTGLPKAKPDENNLGFGKYTTDHMFIMDFDSEHGWHDPRIVPYSPLSLDPATSVLHYAQAVFEGLKAYRARNGGILLF